MNSQHPEGIHYTDTIEFHSAWRTIQGEGPFAGMPAIFIRLTGCNLRCPLCDTEYTSKREALSPDEIVSIVEKLANSELLNRRVVRLVVISGGEPFRQDIKALVLALVNLHHMVQIESNGTICPGPDFPYDLCTIVVSPKTHQVHPGLAPFVDAYKYVLSRHHVDVRDGLPTNTLGFMRPPARPPANFGTELIYVQPLDEQDDAANRANLMQAAKSCMTFGYNLGIQMHKMANLP